MPIKYQHFYAALQKILVFFGFRTNRIEAIQRWCVLVFLNQEYAVSPALKLSVSIFND